MAKALAVLRVNDWAFSAPSMQERKANEELVIWKESFDTTSHFPDGPALFTCCFCELLSVIECISADVEERMDTGDGV